MRWQHRPIAELVDPCNTWNPAGAKGSFAYIDLSSVDKDSKAITQVETLPCAAAPSRARQLITSGDVLVATVRPNLNGVALVDDVHDGMTASTGYCVLRPRSDVLASRYLFQWVKAPRFVDAMVKIATGANYPAVSDAKVKDSLIPLPPLPVQKRIAAILDAADALRAKRRESIEQLDSLVQATFLEMFGDPVTNPKGWEVRPFGQVASNEDGKRVPVKQADREEMQGRYPYYGASGVIDHVDDYLFEGERLLIGEDGANLLARSTPIAFRAHGRYWVNNHAHVLAENGEASLVFLETLINRLDLTQYVSGSAQPKLTQKSLNAIPIPLPPLPSQTRFASIVESIEQQKARLKAHLAELDTLFASLQSRAFNGELVA